MNDPMPPDRLLDAINRRRTDFPVRDIVAYWYRVLTNRGEYAAKLAQLAAGRPVVPMVVRGGFANYNSVTSDLLNLIVEHREQLVPPAFPAHPWNFPSP